MNSLHLRIRRVAVTALFLIVAVAAPRPAWAIVIDSFDVAQSSTANSGASFVVSFASGAGILGGERDVAAQWSSGSGDVIQDVDAGGSGLARFVTDPGTDGASGFAWDGVDGSSNFNNGGLNHADLTDGGTHNAVTVDVAFNPQPIDFLLTVFTDQSNWSAISYSLPGGIVSLQTFTIPFASFPLNTGAGADFSDVGGISMGLFPNVQATSSPNLQIDLIQTVFVPEPASVILAALGTVTIVGACSWRRKR